MSEEIKALKKELATIRRSVSTIEMRLNAIEEDDEYEKVYAELESDLR